jgi:hypothetical protein
MRGLHVQANLGEWVVLILLWPLSLKIYAQLAMVQAMIQNLEHWSDAQDQETG